ncbi:hypothetical protein CBW16_05990 [Flavobacteriaceae bacterium JJC]|nr:hypothetical protein CBW16_05990 [Flavobacteriaceae bacterium JJC]
MDLNIQNKKLELIQWLSAVEDLSVINKIFEIKKEKSDWSDELSEVEKESIEKGLKDLDEGKKVPHSEVKKLYEKWL